MIEIVVGIWLMSFLLSLGMILFHRHLILKRLRSKELRVLNKNLSQVGKIWSIANSDFFDISSKNLEEVQKADEDRALKHAWFLSPLCFFSVIGLALVCAIVVGSHFVGKSRKELAIFSSPLIRNPELSPVEIESLVSEFDAISW